MHYDFNRDLPEGQEAETQLQNYYASIGVNCQRNNAEELGKLRNYDLLCTGGGKFWKEEVKRDRLAQQTHNIAIEHRALVHSRADYFTYKIDGVPGFWQISRAELVHEVAANKFPRVKGGDRSDYMLTLIPLPQFLKLAKQI